MAADQDDRNAFTAPVFLSFPSHSSLFLLFLRLHPHLSPTCHLISLGSWHDLQSTAKTSAGRGSSEISHSGKESQIPMHSPYRCGQGKGHMPTGNNTLMPVPCTISLLPRRMHVTSPVLNSSLHTSHTASTQYPTLPKERCKEKASRRGEAQHLAPVPPLISSTHHLHHEPARSSGLYASRFCFKEDAQ